jgi:hypothetical protein
MSLSSFASITAGVILLLAVAVMLISSLSDSMVRNQEIRERAAFCRQALTHGLKVDGCVK